MEEDREEDEDEEKNWLNGKREPALSDLQKEVIAYRKKREEEELKKSKMEKEKNVKNLS